MTEENPQPCEHECLDCRIRQLFFCKPEYCEYHLGKAAYEADKKAKSRLLDELEEIIIPPKDCPKCHKKWYIEDERGFYCEDHYWIVNNEEGRLRLAVKFISSQREKLK